MMVIKRIILEVLRVVPWWSLWKFWGNTLKHWALIATSTAVTIIIHVKSFPKISDCFNTALDTPFVLFSQLISTFLLSIVHHLLRQCYYMGQLVMSIFLWAKNPCSKLSHVTPPFKPGVSWTKLNQIPIKLNQVIGVWLCLVQNKIKHLICCKFDHGVSCTNRAKSNKVECDQTQLSLIELDFV